MHITGEFVIMNMGDAPNGMKDRQGWLTLGQRFQGPRGEYVAQVLPLLRYWKTAKGSKTPNALAQALEKAEPGKTALRGIEYSYRRNRVGEGKDQRWFDNHELADFDAIVNIGNEVGDESVMPHTDEAQDDVKQGLKKAKAAEDKAEASISS